MKLALVIVLALVALVHSKNLDREAFLDDISSYGYFEKVGVPLAEEIYHAEVAQRDNPSRIVGGSPSHPGQFPYQVGLLASTPIGTGVCGGSLLSNNRVLTAAHCWWDGRNQASQLVVVLGSVMLFSGGVRITTNRVVMHNNWSPALVVNDIAMIQLPQSVSFSSTIAPIALPTGSELNENFAGDMAVASGFGLTRNDGVITTSQFLSHVEVEIVTHAVCWRAFPIIIMPSNICISGANGRSTCRGDSGGPLAVIRNNRRVLVGVTSFGSREGCEAGFPAAFARVTSFMDFIHSNL